MIIKIILTYLIVTSVLSLPIIGIYIANQYTLFKAIKDCKPLNLFGKIFLTILLIIALPLLTVYELIFRLIRWLGCI